MRYLHQLVFVLTFEHLNCFGQMTPRWISECKGFQMSQNFFDLDHFEILSVHPIIARKNSLRRPSKNCSDRVTRPHHIFCRFSDAEMREKIREKQFVFLTYSFYFNRSGGHRKHILFASPLVPDLSAEFLKTQEFFRPPAHLPACILTRTEQFFDGRLRL